MAATDRNIERAEQLFAAHRARQPFVAFSGIDAVAGVDEAYAIQQHFVQLMLDDASREVAGYKIGLTSPRMQALLGIDSPIGGVVFSDRVHDSGLTVARESCVNLALECEIAVRLGSDLDPAAAPFDPAVVAAAVAAVAPAFELVDDRNADYAATDIGSLIADNSWNEGIVLGEFVDDWPALETLTGVVWRDGAAIDQGSGADVLGHPFTPLTWLANHLAGSTRGLRAGDIVATGSLVPTRFITEPERCRFVVEGLGEVEVNVT